MLKAESFHGFQLWASVTWRCSMEFLCTRPSSVWYEVTNLSFSFQWCCKISGFNHPLLYLQTGNAAGFLLLFQDWRRWIWVASQGNWNNFFALIANFLLLPPQWIRLLGTKLEEVCRAAVDHFAAIPWVLFGRNGLRVSAVAVFKF